MVLSSTSIYVPKTISSAILPAVILITIMNLLLLAVKKMFASVLMVKNNQTANAMFIKLTNVLHVTITTDWLVMNVSLILVLVLMVTLSLMENVTSIKQISVLPATPVIDWLELIVSPTFVLVLTVHQEKLESLTTSVSSTNETNVKRAILTIDLITMSPSPVV
jgi:hypothetical protein